MASSLTAKVNPSICESVLTGIRPDDFTSANSDRLRKP